MKLLKPIETYIKILNTETISEERKAILQPLVAYLTAKKTEKQSVKLIFICTHNSRRSHLAQIWAQAMCSYFNITDMEFYSGGTETTALYPTVAETLKTAGFIIRKEDSTENPVYNIKLSIDAPPLHVFSKKYDEDPNPKNGFAAVMTCSQADAGCPFVAGAEKRIAIMYEDPKISDGTSEETKAYLERSKQIAIEMNYVFSQIAQQ